MSAPPSTNNTHGFPFISAAPSGQVGEPLVHALSFCPSRNLKNLPSNRRNCATQRPASVTIQHGLGLKLGQSQNKTRPCSAAIAIPASERPRNFASFANSALFASSGGSSGFLLSFGRSLHSTARNRFGSITGFPASSASADFAPRKSRFRRACQ